MSWRPNISATPRLQFGSKKRVSAKAIVRRAGPQKKWVYAAFLSYNSSGVGAVRVYTPLLLASDYEDNQAQQKERVVLDSFALRGFSSQTPVAGNANKSLTQCALFTANLEVAGEVASNNLDPFSTPDTWEEQDVQLLRTWGFTLSTNAPDATSPRPFDGRSGIIHNKMWRLKLRMQEPKGLYMVTYTQGIGTGATLVHQVGWRVKLRSW